MESCGWSNGGVSWQTARKRVMTAQRTEALATRYNCTGDAGARCRKDKNDDGTETE